MPGVLRAAGAAALTLALLAPTAADADRWSSTDPEGDVVGWHYDPEPKPCGTQTVVDLTDETNRDVTGLRVRHTRRSIVVETRFRDLRRRQEQLSTLYLRTEGGTWWLDVDRYRAGGDWRTETFLSKEPRYPDPDQIDECGRFSYGSVGLRCRISRDVSIVDDLARVVVPRTCLRSPRWVRVGADAYGFESAGDRDDPTFTVFSDEWDGGTVLSDWKVSYGPRVRATTGAPSGAGKVSDPSSVERRHFVIRHDGIFTRL